LTAKQMRQYEEKGYLILEGIFEEYLPESQHDWDIPGDKEAVLTELGRKLVGLDLW